MSKNNDLVKSAAAAAHLDLDHLLAVPKDATNDELLDIVVDSANRSCQYQARTGRALQRLKAQMPHGAFGPALEARGVPERTARNAMQIAAYLESVPVEHARQLLSFSSRNVLKLARADQDAVAAALDQGLLDGEPPVDVRALVKALTSEKQRRIAAEAKLAPYQSRVKQLSDAVPDGIPADLAAKRDQGAYLISALDENLQLLAKLVDDDVAVLNWRGTEDAEGLKSIATVIYHGGNGVGALLLSILEKVAKVYGASVTADVLPALQYPPQARERLKALKQKALAAAEKNFKDTQIAARKKHGARGRHS